MSKLTLWGVALLGLILSACTHAPHHAEVKPYETQPAGWAPRDPASETGHALYTLDTHGRAYIANLNQCGGNASLVNLDGRWVLRVRGSDCANIEINDQRAEKMGGSGQGSRYADVTMFGESGRAITHRIVVRSNSGKNSDTIKVTIRPTIPTARHGDWVVLSDCGGAAQVVIQNGQVNLKFKEVRSCNVFDIVSDNGDITVYEPKEFPNSSASFTLPKRVMEFGLNRVLVQVRSRNGWIEDKFYVSFLAY